MRFEKQENGGYVLDVKGYVCPHPQIYTKKALSKIASGEYIDVMFDNPSSGESIASMCEVQGDEIVDKKKDDGTFIWRIEKS